MNAGAGAGVHSVLPAPRASTPRGGDDLSPRRSAVASPPTLASGRATSLYPGRKTVRDAARGFARMSCSALAQELGCSVERAVERARAEGVRVFRLAGDDWVDGSEPRNFKPWKL